MKIWIVFPALAILTLALPVAAFGSIVNEGSEVVEIRMTKTNGSPLTTMVYPRQTIILPDDVIKVQVLPGLSVRGDETVKIKITEPDGIEKYLKKFGDSINIGDKSPDKLPAVQGKVTNRSNAIVEVVVKRKSRSPEVKRLYPNDYIKLLPDTEEVGIRASGRFWGDEKVKVEVLCPDGRTETLKSFGRKVKLEKEKPVSRIPKFSVNK